MVVLTAPGSCSLRVAACMTQSGALHSWRTCAALHTPRIARARPAGHLHRSLRKIATGARTQPKATVPKQGSSGLQASASLLSLAAQRLAGQELGPWVQLLALLLGWHPWRGKEK